MCISKVKLKQFTAFDDFSLEPSPGINALVGANGTGKTHLMKVAYAACDVSATRNNFAEKLISIFLPSGNAIGRLVRQGNTGSRCVVEISRPGRKLRASFSGNAKAANSVRVTGSEKWSEEKIKSVYIPVKEILSNAPGFTSLYAQREVHFEETYTDILNRAYTPPLRGPLPRTQRKLLASLEKDMEGKVRIRNEEFFLQRGREYLEFSLLAEGIRKLGLLWLLIQNGALPDGSVLFWDEPETNLSPKLFGPVIDILLQLQRMGVQVFLATHAYVILKELELRKEKDDTVFFHSLFRDEKSGQIECASTDDYLQIHPKANAILDTYLDIFDRDVKRNLGFMKKK